MRNTKVLGTGYFVPEKILTNHDLAKIVDTNDEWIRERTGIVKRHICSRDKEEYPTDMGLKATHMALKAAGLEVDDIDMILFASCTPDLPLPNSATILQTKLGIKNKCAALDIAAACSGFVYGFNMANSFIQTGMLNNVLIVGSEMLSPELDWNDRGTCILFGDGCGAAIVGPTPDGESSQVLSGVLGADGTGKDFFLKNHGGATSPITAQILAERSHFMKMQGQEMFKVAVRTLAKNAQKVLKDAGVTAEEVKYVVPHQANIRILEATAKALGMSMDKFIINIQDYGNTSAATVPIAFHEAVADGRIQRGDLILFDAFGAGLTSGATLLRY